MARTGYRPRHLDVDRRRGAPRRLGTAFVQLVLWLAALAGAAATVLVIATAALGMRGAIVRSGSMEPTIPVGAAVWTRAEPAAAIRIGQVVVAPAPGNRTVMHRVLAVAPGPTPGLVTLTLKGDANRTADPVQVPVREVGRVTFFIPGLGRVFSRAASPLGALAMGAALVFAAATTAWDLAGRARRSRGFRRGPVAQPVH